MSDPFRPGEIISTVKGFDQNFQCRGFQFEVGETYEHQGPVVVCESGFHACEHPLNVFASYPPATSRYAAVTQSGSLVRHTSDTKIASARITIDAELKLPDVIARAVKWIFDRAKWSDGPVVAGANEGATASGDQGAATASGDQGAATASGLWGAATASGDQGKARGSEGCALFLVYRDADGKIEHAWAGIAGRNGIKPDTWYRLDASGQPREVA